MELTDLIELAAPFAAIPAVLAFILLLPLYLSQRRDIDRLRSWMESQPDHPAADLRASEARLDRAEAELGRLVGAEAPTVVRPRTEAGLSGASATAARVASERPALERITVERAALDPHPRWRRFSRRVTQPWMLAVIAIVAIVAGAAAIVGSERLLSGGTAEGPGADRFDRSDVTVSVLNGTPAAGLAGRVQGDVAASGYPVDRVGASAHPADRTEVRFRRGQRQAALRVANDLGVREREVQPIDPSTRRLAGDADVVVIAGEDRTR